MKFVVVLQVFFFFYDTNAAKVPPLHSQEWHTRVEEILRAPDPEQDVAVPPVPKDQVSYFLYTKDNRQNPINITEDNLDAISENVDKLFFVIHGWLESTDQKWLEDLKEAILDRYPNSNVVKVDYREPAFDEYAKSMAAVKYVGQILGEFLITINQKKNISTKKMILLPHSLGSHVAGYAGKTVQKVKPRISRIVAMDPAGPRWVDKPCERRLCKTDADVVEVVHTDAGGLGYPDPLGTIDFYPNGGYIQNGCPEYTGNESVDAACAHCRSWTYVIEAIKHPHHFVSEKCLDWKTYDEHRDECDKITLSLGDLEAKHEGVFFFKTRDKAPFAIEEEDENSAAYIWRSTGVLTIISSFLVVFWKVSFKFCHTIP